MAIHLQKETGDGGRIAVWKLTESVNKLLRLHPLSAEERAEFDAVKTPKRQKEWLAVRVLLEEALCSKAVLKHLPSGKPVLEPSLFHLSVSHSADFAAVFLSSCCRVGIEIEKIRPGMPRLKDRFLHPLERQYGWDGNSFLLHLLWGAKEAIFKLSDCPHLLATELYVTDFNFVAQTAVGHIRPERQNVRVHIGFQQLEDHVMVWATG